MAKKKRSASSRPAKLVSVSAESIFSKPLSNKQKAVLSRIAKRQAAGDDSDIDYSDIPPLTDEQLGQFRRAPKVLVAARIDKDVYDWLMQYGQRLFDEDQRNSAYRHGESPIVPRTTTGEFESGIAFQFCEDGDPRDASKAGIQSDKGCRTTRTASASM